MSTKHITLALLTLALLLISAQVALAKELGRVVISGPGLKTPIEITDPELANQFGLALVDNLDTQRIDPPKAPGEDFYTIDRGYRDDQGTIVGYDHVRYYPDPETGKGWFQFMGTDGYESKYEGIWFQPSLEGEQTLLMVLAEHGVTFKTPDKVTSKDPAAIAAPQKEIAPQKEAAPAQAETVTAAQSAPSAASLPLVVGGAVVLMLAVGAGAVLARSRRAQKADA